MKIDFWGVIVLPEDGTAALDIVNIHIQERLDACGGKYYPTGMRLDFDFTEVGEELDKAHPFIEVEHMRRFFEHIGDVLTEESDHDIPDGSDLFLCWSEDGKLHVELLAARSQVTVCVNTRGSLKGPWEVPA